MAKPGGKKDGEKQPKRTRQDKIVAASAKHGPATKGAKSGKSKPDKSMPGRGKTLKNATELVEKVAAQIVAAELDRALDADDLIPSPQRSARPRVTSKSTSPQAAEPDKSARSTEPLNDLLRVPAAPVDLGALDPGATPGVESREHAEAQLPLLDARLTELQVRLFASARGGSSKSRVLLLLQGMDTSGKGGAVRHVVGVLDPNGVRVTAFKAPTEEEKRHDFLWRIRQALPAAGEVGVFDRSHYEDVLIARVRKLALPMVIGRRYALINKFEQGLAADGCVLVKVFLHISSEEQKRRLLTRLDDPTKHWKYNPGDVDDRALWPQYQEAYRIALEKSSTALAPWYVIPADHKWYRDYAVTRLLVEALERIDPVYPPGDFDIESERRRVEES